MRVRSLVATGLAAILAVAMVGCAGDTPAEPSDSELTLPTQTASESETDAPLDLESMSDEELLAEAERAYQGFLDDVEELRAEGGTDYMSLTDWADESYLKHVNSIYTDYVPEGAAVEGVQEIIAIELADKRDWESGEVRTNMCIDNSPLQLVDADGAKVATFQGPETSDGSVIFVPSSNGTHLIVKKEIASTESSQELCDA